MNVCVHQGSVALLKETKKKADIRIRWTHCKKNKYINAKKFIKSINTEDNRKNAVK